MMAGMIHPLAICNEDRDAWREEYRFEGALATSSAD
jgi:hypothetical protein